MFNFNLVFKAVKRQQKYFIQQQELLLQAQEQHLMKQQQTIAYQQQMLTKQQPPITVTSTVHLSGISTVRIRFF